MRNEYYLTLEERRIIEEMYAAGAKPGEIAKRKAAIRKRASQAHSI